MFSHSWRDHLRHLDAVQTVLQWLMEAGLTAKPGKCQFGMWRCSYLGHVVGGGEVRVQVSKIEVVERIKLPKMNDVRTFLVLTGYITASSSLTTRPWPHLSQT